MATVVTTGDFFVPGDPRSPIRIDLEEHALRLAIVRRDDLSFLNKEEWGSPGVYVLIGPQSGDKKTKVYVGKGIGADGLRGRLATQNTSPTAAAKFPWWKVAAFARSTVEGFHSSQVGYLEGKIASELKDMDSLEVSSGKKDSDETLKSAHLTSLDALIPSFMAGLRIAGLQLVKADEVQVDETVAIDTPGKKKRFFDVSIAQLVESGDLTPGDVFVYERVGESRSCRVTGNGTLLVNETEYKSPSTAAVAAYDGTPKAAAGWEVWKREGSGETLYSIRAEYLERMLTDSESV
jgi:hypothetical protein